MHMPSVFGLRNIGVLVIPVYLLHAESSIVLEVRQGMLKPPVTVFQTIFIPLLPNRKTNAIVTLLLP